MAISSSFRGRSDSRLSEKRRDSKGRVLRSGEYQGKNGRYEYKYQDSKGVRRSAYSWKLVESDKVPEGKRCKESLREIEKRLRRDVEDGINSHVAYRTTLNAFWDSYIETKYELKQSTRTNYRYMYKKYVSETIGHKDIASIKYSDIKRFYIHLIRDIGFKPNSMEIINRIAMIFFIASMPTLIAPEVSSVIGISRPAFSLSWFQITWKQLPQRTCRAEATTKSAADSISLALTPRRFQLSHLFSSS